MRKYRSGLRASSVNRDDAIEQADRVVPLAVLLVAVGERLSACGLARIE